MPRSVAVVVAGRGGGSASASGRCAARGDGLPGEARAVEAVTEVVTVRLTRRRVELERVQRPAVVGELSQAVRALYRAELARQAARAEAGRACRHREPEAEAR